MSRRTKPDRLGLRFLTCLLTAPTVYIIMNDMTAIPDPEVLKPYLFMGACLGAFHVILRPLLRILSIVPGCLTAVFSGFILDMALVYLSAYIIPAVSMPTLTYSVLTCAVINIICGILSL